MKTKILIPLAGLAFCTFAHAQVTYISNLPATGSAPQAGAQGDEVDLSDDAHYLIVGGIDVELYTRCGQTWSHELLNQAVGFEVALGTNYYATGGGFSGITIYDLDPGTSYAYVTFLSSVSTAGFAPDQGDHIAFAGNDLAVYTGSELRIYTPPFSSTNYTVMTPPTNGYAAMAHVDGFGDEIAIAGSTEAVVYQKVGGTWGPNPEYHSGTVFPGGTMVNGIAIHDDRMMLSGGTFGGDPYVAVFDKTGGTWGLTESFTFSSSSTDANCWPGARIAFTGDYAFVNDGTGSSVDQTMRVLQYDAVNSTWNNPITSLNDDVGTDPNNQYGAYGLAAQAGFVAIGDTYDAVHGNGVGSVNTYFVCGPDGSPCETDCDPGTTEIWDACSCVLAPQCVELLIQYGATSGSVSWNVGGQTGSEPSSPTNTTSTYTYDLAVGTQGSPIGYQFYVDAPAGAVIGWMLRTCDDHRMILNNDGDWSPPSGTTTSGPGESGGTKEGCDGSSSPMTDFELPLGPLTITSNDGINPLKWSNCAESNSTPSNLYVATATGQAGVGYEYQFFDPDGRVSIMEDANTGCANNGDGRCVHTWTTTGNAGSLSVSSLTTLRIRRGRWLDLRARPTNGNLGEACYICFEKVTGPGSTITCPSLLSGNVYTIPLDYSPIELWPNPNATGTVELHLMDLDEEATSAEITVTDAMGRLVHRERIATEGSSEIRTSFQVHGLATGLYQVQVTSGPRTFFQRLMIE